MDGRPVVHALLQLDVGSAQLVADGRPSRRREDWAAVSCPWGLRLTAVARPMLARAKHVGVDHLQRRRSFPLLAMLDKDHDPGAGVIDLWRTSQGGRRGWGGPRRAASPLFASHVRRGM
eukprot:6447680-Pyramimonas_sp.AAC.1